MRLPIAVIALVLCLPGVAAAATVDTAVHPDSNGKSDLSYMEAFFAAAPGEANRLQVTGATEIAVEFTSRPVPRETARQRRLHLPFTGQRNREKSS